MKEPRPFWEKRHELPGGYPLELGTPRTHPVHQLGLDDPPKIFGRPMQAVHRVPCCDAWFTQWSIRIGNTSYGFHEWDDETGESRADQVLRIEQRLLTLRAELDDLIQITAGAQ